MTLIQQWTPWPQPVYAISICANRVLDSCCRLPTPDIHFAVVSDAGLHSPAQQTTKPRERMIAAQPALLSQHDPPFSRFTLGSTSKQASTLKQRCHAGRPALQSPFATCETQQVQTQPEELKASSRKRGRVQSAELDSNPPTKFAQASNKQQASAADLVDDSTVTLHKPTPHRPNASTPCCFGVVSAAQPLRHSHLKSSSLGAARASPAAKPVVCTVVPSSLTSAATLADSVMAGKSSGSCPSDDDRASPTRPEHSQDCKHCQGNLLHAVYSSCFMFRHCSLVIC